MGKKRIETTYGTGKTLYARIHNIASPDLYYDDGDGTFKAYAEANVVVLTEDTNIKGQYLWAGGDSVAWPNGIYPFSIFQQAGGAPNDDGTDIAIGNSQFNIDGDVEPAPATSTDVKRLLGLSHENIYMHTRVYDLGLLQSAKLDVYDSKANAETHDGVTGIVAKYTQTFTYDVAPREEDVLIMSMVRDS